MTLCVSYFICLTKRKKWEKWKKQRLKLEMSFLYPALFVESNISDYISEKLEINSESSNQSEHKLNFDQKVELILEMDKLSIIDKSKLSVFQRN